MNCCLVVSYNRPKFDQYASWSANAITFATISTVGYSPFSLFVNTNNTIFAVDRQNGRIQIWHENDINPRKTLAGNLIDPHSFFVTVNGEIYMDNSYINNRVEKWNSSTNSSVIEMFVGGRCMGLFINVNDVLYCSMPSLHQVVTKSMSSVSDALTIVAGTGCSGSNQMQLDQAHGIFVDTNLDLYVADSANHRVQLFRSGELNGITMAGSGSINVTITLNYPSGIVLDGDTYLFIVDHDNNRIVRSSSNGFQCIVGCYGSGSASNQLSGASMMAFDSHGNIFVVDRWNSRIQKFILLNYTLRKSDRIISNSENCEIDVENSFTVDWNPLIIGRK